jgi:hypothetical protein
MLVKLLFFLLAHFGPNLLMLLAGNNFEQKTIEFFAPLVPASFSPVSSPQGP